MGGEGKLFNACYSHIERGVVFEKSWQKAELLARQRPTWAVYASDCIAALQLGAGRHLPVNLLDVDPYGDPWPVIDAFLTSERPRPENLYIVVNDGLRQNIRLGTAWTVETLKPIVRRYGNNLYDKYLDVCFALMGEKAAQAGYSLRSFDGYYCGFQEQITHYYAVLHRRSDSGGGQPEQGASFRLETAATPKMSRPHGAAPSRVQCATRPTA